MLVGLVLSIALAEAAQTVLQPQQSFIGSIFGDVVTEGEASSKASSEVSASFLHLPPNDDLSDFRDYQPLFSGIVSFAHLPQMDCFLNESAQFDIGIVGAPFDSGVSYAPGARFGPNGVRQGSRRLGAGLSPIRGNSPDSRLRKTDPYHCGQAIVDCGDVPMNPFDARVALNQLYRGERAAHNRTSPIADGGSPRLITLGGDHTITLMNLRSAYETAGEPLAVVHFDAHIDTWDPKVLGGNISSYSELNHGTFLHFASELGYVAHNHSVHVGTRAPYIAKGDIKHDVECGFDKITSKDVDVLSPVGVGRRIKQLVHGYKVYITFDMDTFDIPYVNSGTLEAGGLTPREVLTILDELEGIELVGADVVEVNTPPGGFNDYGTGVLAAQVVDTLLGLMVVAKPPAFN